MITTYVSIQPGVMTQKVFIQKEIPNEENIDRSVETLSCSLNDLSKFLITCKPNKIVLNGNNEFTSRIEKEIKEIEITKYGKNEIEITKGDMF